jgi:UDP-2,3-diacylglucosamine pyrophosphatase LpxH
MQGPTQLPAGADPSPSALSRGRSLFVVGDVHLHASADPSTAGDLARLLDRLGAEDPRCCVVFNGDLFDLDRVPGEAGCGVGEQRVARRVSGVLDRFPDVARAMRQHVSRGGSVLFVAGNHDAELLLPAVQRVLAERVFGDGGSPGPDAGACTSPGGAALQRVVATDRLALDQVRIEHGHQGDPDSAFFPDTLSAVRKGRLTAFPLACLLTRLFVTQNPRLEPLGDIYKTPAPVLWRVLRDYKLDGLRMILHYPLMGLRIAGLSVLARMRNDAPRRDEACSMSSPWRVVRRLYLDRYLVAVASLVLLGGYALGWLPKWIPWVAAVAAVYLVVPPVRKKAFLHRDVRASAEEARALAREGAKLVVFGHTHRPFITNLGDAIYANHGAFSIPVQVDAEGQVCRDAGGVGIPATNGQSRRARPYLAVTTDPVGCDLRALV